MAKPRKYQPLVDYLAAQSAVAVTLTFVEIEELIGAPLPQAVATRIWWHNSWSPSRPTSDFTAITTSSNSSTVAAE